MKNGAFGVDFEVLEIERVSVSVPRYNPLRGPNYVITPSINRSTHLQKEVVVKRRGQESQTSETTITSLAKR